MQTTEMAPLKPTPVRDILWLFCGTRLLLMLCTFVSFVLFPVPAHVYLHPGVDVSGLLTSWNHWDAIIYTTIAQQGYTNLASTAFFPLFPLLVKGLAVILDHHYTLAAMLVSNLALLGTLFLLYQIATDILGEQVGRRTLVYLCFFPTAFFFFAGYNESLFLFLTCGSIFALRRHKWLLAGVFGFFAALTRPAGVLLVIPYLYEIWLTYDSSQSLSSQFKRLLTDILPIALTPTGTLLYCLYCLRRFANPLAFLTAEKGWGKTATFPWYGIFYSLWRIFFHEPFGSFIEIHILLDLGATLGFILLTILGIRRLRPTYTIWIILLLLTILSSSSITEPDALISNQRYVLEMFPAFITLAALGIKYPRLHQAMLFSFPFLQAILAALFVLNRWMI